MLREEILGWPRMVQLVEELGLDKGIRSPLAFERLILKIRRNISVRMKGPDIITILYRSQDPLITQKIANTLSDIFIRRNLDSQSEEANAAIDFVKDQLQIYKRKLEESEESLRKFKETYGLQMPLAIRINTELARLQAELITLLVDCTDEHPRVKELRRRIQSLKEQRVQQIKNAAEDAGVEAQRYIKIAESAPKQEQELARLTRDTRVNEEIYATLLKKLETARISQQLESSENKTKFRIVEPARLPLRPVKPNKVKFCLMGLMLGGMASFGCVYLVENMDRSFKGIEDLKGSSNLPVLGSISEIITDEDIRKRRLDTKRTAVILGIFILILISVIITIGVIF